MANLVADHMANHGTCFLRQCVPVSVERSGDGRLLVHWRNLSSGENRGDTFDTVMFAVGTCCSRVGPKSLEGTGGGGEGEKTGFLALNFCCLADCQKLWYNCSFFVNTFFNPN